MALFLAVTTLGSVVTACTPKPDSAQPTFEALAAAMESRDVEGIASNADEDAAGAVFAETFDGLQADGLSIEVEDFRQDESVAYADYSMTWSLPRDREFRYESSMTLSKVDGQWAARWQPSIIHPELGANQHLELRAEEAKRASVVSSDGVALMEPGLQYRLIVDTGRLKDTRPVAGRIASAIAAVSTPDNRVEQIDAAALAKRLDKAEGNYSVAVYPEGEGQEISEILDGEDAIRVNEEPAMVTRDPGFAPDLMQRINREIGDDVEGTRGWNISVVNEHGAAQKSIEYHAPEPAPAIKVGIDYDVQRAAEQAVNLQAGSEAMMVAIRPSNGDILAVAQTPQADKQGDIALSGQYPPGSVFKIITAAAGIEDQGLAGNSIVPCPGTMNIFGRTVVNYNGFGLGSVPLTQAFARSCNTTFADISTQLEEGKLQEIGKRFGIGLDYEIPGLTTVTGSIPVGETPLERTEAGYGQGADLASPFGFALVSSTVAAGATPVPSLLSRDETKVSEKVPAPRKETVEQLRAMMRQTVVNGTASGMQASGEIFGKTGEAEINDGSHSWFTGFRDDDIAFATLIVRGGGSEAAVAVSDSFFQNLDRLRTDS